MEDIILSAGVNHITVTDISLDVSRALVIQNYEISGNKYYRQIQDTSAELNRPDASGVMKSAETIQLPI